MRAITPSALTRVFGLVLAAAALGCDTLDQGLAGAETEEAPRAAEFRSARVEAAIERADQTLRTRGFVPFAAERRGFLVDQATDVAELSLRSGTCYAGLAVGSSALRELDLRIFDSTGNEVVQDTTTGAAAALLFCPAQSGAYYLAVRASAGSGLFAVRSFQGPTGLDVRVDDVFGPDSFGADVFGARPAPLRRPPPGREVR